MNSPANLKLLAQGNTAEIYDYGAGKILKLFRENFPSEPVLAEYEKANLISQELSNTPKVYDLITRAGRPGIIYEKITGPSMTAVMLKSPHKIKQISQRLAKIHFDLHFHCPDHPYPPSPSRQSNQLHWSAFTSVKDKLAADIDAAPVLTSAEKSHIKSYLRSLPDGVSFLHFDFHPGNILMPSVNSSSSNKTSNQPPNPSVPPGSRSPVIIDWMTSCIGDPCADVARTYLLLKYGELAYANFVLRKTARPLEAYIGKIYLTEYLKLSHLSPTRPNLERSDVEKWFLPIAAARLREWVTPHEQKQLLNFIHRTLPSS